MNKRKLNFQNQPLSSLQKEVLYNDKTEPPFENLYWNHWEPGLYVHAQTGQALFSSYDKYSCLCGWPAFYRVLKPGLCQIVADYSHNMVRNEVRTIADNAHLGHVFNDLDARATALGYQRFCINSATLIFVKKETIMASNNEEWKQAWTQSDQTNFMNLAVITIAGGCFWGVQHLIRHLSGVYWTAVGYANAKNFSPPLTYKQVCSGKTDAVEVVQVFYNKKILSLTDLLTAVFNRVDPTTLNQQGNDVGSQYRSGIYYTDATDQAIINKWIETDLQPKHIKKVVCEVLALSNFYLAESEHQDYLVKNPNGYCHIKF